MILMIIELLVVLLALYVGSRYGSLALGAISGIGLALLVFGFGMKPGSPIIKQHPLLFDEHEQPKPCVYQLIDAAK